MKSLKRSVLTAVIGIGCFTLATWGHAAERGDGGQKGAKSPNMSPAGKQVSPTAAAVSTAQLAARLIAYGDAHKDAMALIVAQHIQNQLGAQAEKAPKSNQGAAADAKADPKQQPLSTVIERATQYAAGRKDLIALANEVAQSRARGSVRGPRIWEENVRPGNIDVYTVSFTGGQLARFAISGDGATDLDLIIKDEFGNVICQSDGPTDDEMCSWVPKFTSGYRVEIHNLDRRMENRYRIGHN